MSIYWCHKMWLLPCCYCLSSYVSGNYWKYVRTTVGLANISTVKYTCQMRLIWELKKQTAEKMKRVLSPTSNINFCLSHELISSFTSEMICLIVGTKQGVLNGKRSNFCFPCILEVVCWNLLCLWTLYRLYTYDLIPIRMQDQFETIWG